MMKRLKTGPEARIRILNGLQAVPIQVRFGLAVLWRWLFRRKQYPFLILNPLKGGFLRTVRLLWRLKLTKIIAVGKGCHFSLVEPRWPSGAYDRLIAKGGLNLAAAGTVYKNQIDLAILAITRRCAYSCRHCYERHNISAHDTVSVQHWQNVIADMQQCGVNVIVLSGGEPMLRFDSVIQLLRAGNKDLSDFHMHTTGHGITSDRVKELKAAGLIAAGIGLDDIDRQRHDAFRGFKGAFDAAVNALKLFASAGVLTYVNMCLTKPMLLRENLFRFYEFINDLGAGSLQLLEPIACGAYGSERQDVLFTPEDRSVVTEFFLQTYRGRWKRYPAVYYNAYLEAPQHLGCMMGGLSHLHIDSMGNVKPCVFLPVSFGNITADTFGEIYGRMRKAVPHPLHTGCSAIKMAGHVRSLSLQGVPAPVPYERVATQWDAMFSKREP